MGLNRKGIFFMMLTLVIISLFLLSVTFFSTLSYRESVQKRVETLSDFVNSVEDDLPRQLFIFGYRSIFLMENEIVKSGSYLGNGEFPEQIRESFFNGTIMGENQDLLAGSTYDDLVLLLDERASRISAEIDVANPVINATQEDPWNVKLTLQMDFTVSDARELALWNKTLESVVYISIHNFTDPLYLREAGIDKEIIRNPSETFGTLASLNTQLQNGYYRNYSNAPSFIDRLEGNIGGIYPFPRFDEYGIESFVHLEDDLGGGSQPERSVVDYLFFNDGLHSSCRVGTGTLPSWFRLDSDHVTSYGVSCS